MRTKKPTLAQKKLMKAAGLDWTTWNVAEEDNNSITLISKKSGRKRVLLKQEESFMTVAERKEENALLDKLLKILASNQQVFLQLDHL